LLATETLFIEPELLHTLLVAISQFIEFLEPEPVLVVLGGALLRLDSQGESASFCLACIQKIAIEQSIFLSDVARVLYQLLRRDWQALSLETALALLPLPPASDGAEMDPIDLIPWFTLRCRLLFDAPSEIVRLETEPMLKWLASVRDTIESPDMVIVCDVLWTEVALLAVAAGADCAQFVLELLPRTAVTNYHRLLAIVVGRLILDQQPALAAEFQEVLGALMEGRVADEAVATLRAIQEIALFDELPVPISLAEPREFVRLHIDYISRETQAETLAQYRMRSGDS
jgi:hypothetical protein